MAKNYIFGPVELEFVADGNIPSYFFSEGDEGFDAISGALNAITEGTVLQFDDMAFNYVGLIGSQYLFIENGVYGDIPDPSSNTDPFAFIDTEMAGYISICTIEPDGTYTVSIYTETDDPEPTPSGDLTPETREEHYLYAIANGTSLPEDMGEPRTREEIFLQAILDSGGGGAE